MSKDRDDGVCWKIILHNHSLFFVFFIFGNCLLSIADYLTGQMIPQKLEATT
jgi:hypothetical protein